MLTAAASFRLNAKVTVMLFVHTTSEEMLGVLSLKTGFVAQNSQSPGISRPVNTLPTHATLGPNACHTGTFGRQSPPGKASGDHVSSGKMGARRSRRTGRRARGRKIGRVNQLF